MPIYEYGCNECGAVMDVNHAMGEEPLIKCLECGRVMSRVFTMPHINWNGPKPSDGGIAPVPRRMIDGAPRKRDEYAGRHEEHERATADE